MQNASRTQEVIDAVFNMDATSAHFEHAMLRTTQDDRKPALVYFRPDGAYEIQLQVNRDKGDTNERSTLRRAIGMLGAAGWEMVTDAYFESRWLDHGRRELYFKRRIER